jgi:hypothetical protein
MSKREIAGWLTVAALGGAAGYYAGCWWLRRQWELFLEGK